MNVLLVTPKVWPKGGGVAIHVQNMAYHLKNLGHDAEIFSIDKSNRNLNYRNRMIEGFKVTYFSSIIELLKSILKSEAKIIHFHAYRNPMIAITMILTNLLKKRHIIFTPHAIFPPQSLWMKIVKNLYDITLGNLSLSLSDKIIALTSENRSEIISCGGRPSQIVIIPNGVKLSIYKNLPSDRKFRDEFGLDEKYILFVGRLAWHKGLDTLVMAMRGISELGLKLVLIGEDGGMKVGLEKLVLDHGLEKEIIFAGKVKFETLLSAYSGCELFVLPSSHEGLPTVILEAMACGKVVVSTHSVARNLIKNGVNGYLINYGDHKEIENVVENILLNANSYIIQKNAIKAVESYDWNRLINKIIELYYEEIS